MIRKQTRLWTTKDGRKVRICDMDENHLNNTINMLARSEEVLTYKILDEGCKMLYSLQGEMAIYSVEGEMDRIMYDGLYPHEIHPLYGDLLLEQKRRSENDKS